MKDWFSVDKNGLANLLAGRGKEFIIYELLQNAWDQTVRLVEISLTREKGGVVQLEVTDDDPDGFRNLADAYTLFGDTTKRHDATKRGRFNLGEKFVLACCTHARITTTKGAIDFSPTGRRISTINKRGQGSCFSATLRMTKPEFLQCCGAVRRVIPPTRKVFVGEDASDKLKVRTYFNGQLIPSRTVMVEFPIQLPTIVADETGAMKRTARLTVVELYLPAKGETSMLYEMGIPVVEIDVPWHVNVQQKIPLNINRDNVTPAYARRLKAAVLSETFELINETDAAEKWVSEALEDREHVTPEVVRSVIKTKHGDKVAVRDPSDPESRHRAVALGYEVVSGAAYSRKAWDNIRAAGAMSSTSTVAPTPKPYSESGKEQKELPSTSWTPEISALVSYAYQIAKKVLGRDSFRVRVVDDSLWGFEGTYGGACLTVNQAALGDCDPARAIAFIIHEFAHEFERNHLSDSYHQACCALGAKLALDAAHDKTFLR